VSAWPEGTAGLDIYLLDQLLRGRVGGHARVLDAGCGKGRNLTWFLARGHDCHAIDRDAERAQATRELFARYAAPEVARGVQERVRCEAIEDLSAPEAAFDLVICNAVLHFARDEAHLRAMLAACWARVAPGGVFFARLASTIGLPMARCQSLGGRRYVQPDGDTRLLVDQQLLLELTADLGAELLDPLKTTVVQDRRCMTTCVLGRPAQA